VVPTGGVMAIEGVEAPLLQVYAVPPEATSVKLLPTQIAGGGAIEAVIKGFTVIV
jgi:hypothetical protein